MATALHEQDAHWYALRESAGVPVSLRRARKRLRLRYAVVGYFGLFVLVIGLATGTPSTMVLGFLAALMVGLYPAGPRALAFMLSIALSKPRLVLQYRTIGQRTYKASETLDSHTADAFLAAERLVIDTPSPMLHGSRYFTYPELPGVSVCVAQFGQSKTWHAFLFGSPKPIMAAGRHLWDLGHIRNFFAADQNRMQQSVSGYKATATVPVGLAYTRLSGYDGSEPPAIETITSELTILGLVGLRGKRDHGGIYALAPSQVVAAATASQLTALYAMAALSLIHVAAVAFGIPVGLQAWHIITLVLVLPLLPLAALAWDPVHTQKTAPSHAYSPLAKSLLLATFGYGAYYTKLMGEGVAFANISSQAVANAAAFGVLTTGLCICMNLLLERSGNRIKMRHHFTNPAFYMAMICAVLLLLTSVRFTGNVGLVEGVGAICLSIMFVAVCELQAHANTHHTRDHILALLKTS